MTLAQLRASLAIWERRHRYRQRMLNRAHKRNDGPAVAKWHRLLSEAGANVRARRREIAAARPKPSNARARVVAAAQQAAANYRRQPWAYHYLAGGVANTVIMNPTPRHWRSDCSQFVVNCYRHAGAACPGSGSYPYSSTYTICTGGRVTLNPQPGDLALYGSRWAPHHVELYIGNGRFIGHGTQPIDSATPGWPSFFLSFL